MNQLQNPMFLDVKFLGLHKSDKKPPRLSVRINLNVDDTIYTDTIKSKTQVIGYVDNETRLYVANVSGVEEKNSIYHLFRLEAVRFAQIAVEKKLDELSAMNDAEYKAKGYKEYGLIEKHLYNCLNDRQDLYTDLQKQVNLISSKKMPKVNEYLLFEDDTEMVPATVRLDYQNPKTEVLTDEQKTIVDNFLDVFLDGYNKRSLAWYFGAALLNIPIHDDRISKMMIVSSSRGGSGKSTLINALCQSLFTRHFSEVIDDFDAYFAMDNRFAVSALPAKRVLVYSEAEFNRDSKINKDDKKKSDFTGLNVSTIKSMITEGFVSNEIKHGGRSMETLNGFHVVLTNNPPVIGERAEALNRRILPLMVKPTTMASKAKTLNLWGKSSLSNFVEANKQAFANYFVHEFLKDEYAFTDVKYDHADYSQDIVDSSTELEFEESKKLEEISKLRTEGVISLLNGLAEQNNWDIHHLIDDVQLTLDGEPRAEVKEDMRIDGTILYLNSTKTFLLQYGPHGVLVRPELIRQYGKPIKKFHKRMIPIPTK